MIYNTGINAIDSLLGDYAWTKIAGTAANLTYSFMLYPPSDLSASDLYGLVQMTSVQKTATITALASWTAVANISFAQVAETSYGAGGDIRFADNNQGSVSAAYTLSYNDGLSLSGAYVFLNTKSPSNSMFDAGFYGLSTLVHEIGHALGLKHPGDYNAGGGGESPPFLPSTTDNLDYTIMSYNDGTAQTSSYSYPSAPMLYDIQAIQYLYGANMSYHTGDDTYSFNNTNIPVCIWDAGGVNTFDFSGCTNKVLINLNAGTFSQTSPGINNISIAYNVSIQNATTGNGGSTIYCNDLNNHITGGMGNDLVIIGKGISVIDGGGGTNTLQVTTDAHDISLETLSRIQILDMNDQIVSMQHTQLPLFQAVLHAANGVVFTDNGNITAVPSINNYTLANSGANFLTISALSDHMIVTGGTDIDTVVLGGSAADYQLAKTVDGYKVTTFHNTNDLTVATVDRLQAADIKLAVDLSGSGHGAATVEVLGAAFGKENILPDYVGIGLELYDSGMTMHDVCQLAIDTDLFRTLAGSVSNIAFVNLVYKNVMGVLPNNTDLNYFSGLLQGSGGTLTQTDLLEYAALTTENQTQINLSGLQTTGVVYI